MQTRPLKTDGLELIRPPTSYTQRGRPVTTFSANSRPSAAPTKTVPPTTTGDDSTGAFVFNCHSVWPSERRKAVTVPPWELTIRRGPAIAGVDAVKPAALRLQIVRPVLASI